MSPLALCVTTDFAKDGTFEVRRERERGCQGGVRDGYWGPRGARRAPCAVLDTNVVAGIAFAREIEVASGERGVLDIETLQEVVDVLAGLEVTRHVVRNGVGVREADARRLLNKDDIGLLRPREDIRYEAERAVGIRKEGAEFGEEASRERRTARASVCSRAVYKGGHVCFVSYDSREERAQDGALRNSTL